METGKGSLKRQGEGREQGRGEEEKAEEGKGRQTEKGKERANLLPTCHLWLTQGFRQFQNDANKISMRQKGHKTGISGLCSGKSLKEMISHMNLAGSVTRKIGE